MPQKSYANNTTASLGLSANEQNALDALSFAGYSGSASSASSLPSSLLFSISRRKEFSTEAISNQAATAGANTGRWEMGDGDDLRRVVRRKLAT